MRRGLQFNASGYYDSTAHQAILRCDQDLRKKKSEPTKPRKKHIVGVMHFDDQPAQSLTGFMKTGTML